jgi:hypothetical protein
VRIAPGLTGADVELPSMPRAAQEFLMAREAVMAKQTVIQAGCIQLAQGSRFGPAHEKAPPKRG